MASLGFWGRARQSPDWIAAIEADDTEHRAGDLLGSLLFLPEQRGALHAE